MALKGLLGGRKGWTFLKNYFSNRTTKGKRKRKYRSQGILDLLRTGPLAGEGYFGHYYYYQLTLADRKVLCFIAKFCRRVPGGGRRTIKGEKRRGRDRLASGEVGHEG